ncbi:MAG: toll/interleukin-1 receptor domain-containing protein [Desulfobacterales bacterium]
MANPEHLEILKQGVDVWNRWREDNPDVKPDLDGADLSSADLSRMHKWVDLSRADLTEANLSRANLSMTDLSGANLSRALLFEADLGANLTGAELIRADLTKADLSGAELSMANLSEANLRMTNFSGANLSGTEFYATIFQYTIFGNVDLRAAVGLENVVHFGPSTIGIDTISASGGKIPEAFLRGCGVPENFIQYMSSLTGKAFEYYSCFISYSSKDQDFAERLYSDLQNKRVRCWFAPEDMKIGDKIRDRIDQSISIHDKLLLILSEHSINSEWVEDEVEAAYEQERNRGKTVLFPIRLDSAVEDTDKAWASKLRRSRHIGDFTKWKDHDAYQKAFDRLMRDLKAEEPAGND